MFQISESKKTHCSAVPWVKVGKGGPGRWKELYKAKCKASSRSGDRPEGKLWVLTLFEGIVPILGRIVLICAQTLHIWSRFGHSLQKEGFPSSLKVMPSLKYNCHSHKNQNYINQRMLCSILCPRAAAQPDSPGNIETDDG